MTAQTTLFPLGGKHDIATMNEAAQAARDAVQAVTDAADEAFLEEAYKSLVYVAMRQTELISAHVRAHLNMVHPEIKPREPRAWAAIMLRGARAGIILRTDRTAPSGEYKNHNLNQRVWKSQVCK